MTKVAGLHNNEEVLISKMKSILFSAEMVKMAAMDVAQTDQFKNDPRIKRIKVFSPSWASELLKTAEAKKHKIHAKDRSLIRPAPADVQVTMTDIQKVILDSGLPADNIFSVDETGVQMEAQFLSKFVMAGTNEKATDDADEKKRITDMAAISVTGQSLPPYIIIQCSSKKADLSNTKVLDNLLVKLNDGDFDRWTKNMWEKTLQLPSKKTKQLEPVTFKRPYLLDSQSGNLICFSV